MINRTGDLSQLRGIRLLVEDGKQRFAEAAKEGAALRLRPIMMTMLVATLGLLPAALSHDIGSDSQRPFAIVIVGGLIVELIISVVMLPALYVFWARPDDKLPPPEMGFIEEGEHVD